MSFKRGNVGWQEDVVSALEAWVAHEGVPAREPRWRSLGRAVGGREPGTYVIDVRGSDIATDQLQGDSLRLSGPDESAVDAGHTVLDVFKDGTALRVRVAEFADPDDPHLWMKPQPTGFLVKALREGLAKLTDAPLAHQMARGEAGAGRLAPTGPATGTLSPAQDSAYRACTGEGLWLVWGPPGTGKTTVLKRAIGDLAAKGKRVLLVSATNIAVDNALWGVVKERLHSDGEIVRVGPPHLREIAEDAGVCLTAMIRERLTDIEEQRRAVATQLTEARARARHLAELEQSLTDFRPVEYATDLARLNDPVLGRAALENSREHAARTEQAARERVARLEQARPGAAEAVSGTDGAVAEWAAYDELAGQLDKMRQAITGLEAKALLAEGALTTAEAHLGELEQLKGFARRRARTRITEARTWENEAREDAAEAARKVEAAQGVLARTQQKYGSQLAVLRDRIPFSKEEIGHRRAALERLDEELRSGRSTAQTSAARLVHLDQELRLTEGAHERVAKARGYGHPQRHALAQELKPQVASDERGRPSLERRHRELQEQYDKLARDAQGEIIGAAKVVATTLARFRTNKAVLDGEYDAVLVDEAGAATLPEVLLAVGKARTTAVLLGDFMQLGPVLPQLDGTRGPDVARWILREVYEHFGIDSAAGAVAHPGCVVLDVQHRFGHDVMRLANAIAYDGVLRPGPGVVRRAALRGPDDPEIVIIDTDGLGNVAEAHRTGQRKGWWPAGSLLARALLDLHREDGEAAGVVTPYQAQAEATLETLRDTEATGGKARRGGNGSPLPGAGVPGGGLRHRGGRLR
ncbi:AAA domain-containing protein [Streptomyces albidoflavus]|uniref:AAA domain-containing protein n=1 Tax=Streptomyces albidoflavus TaxID=1886 RepID=UPI0033F5D143